MKKFKFQPPNEEDVIMVDAVIDDFIELKLALDTAATHSTFDSNMLQMLGYEFKDAVRNVAVETSNGVIFMDIFKIERLELFGVLRENVEVQIYDFIAHGIVSNYDGVIGLDFLRQIKFCLDIENGILTIQD